MASEAEVAAMRRALAAAQARDFRPGPNPRVGAVILSAGGEHIATAHHRGSGTPHAEAAALELAGDRTDGSTVVVTLEPCNHTGRTGPCAQTLVDAGVARVVYAQHDPNPDARGGADTLRAAGVDVEAGVLADEAAALNHAWTFAMAHERPFLTWKLAGTIDGRSAAADGTSQWITGTAARADVHRLRAECDTVLVGTGTVVADNPRLTVRDTHDRAVPRERQPRRAVMGLRSLDPGANVLDAAAETCVLTTRDPEEALKRLFSAGSRHVWLEGGPTLAAVFLTGGYVDEVIAYVAPAFLGSGRSAVADLGVGTINDAIRLNLVDVTRVGDDVRLTMRRRS